LAGRVGVKKDTSQLALKSVADFAVLADARLSFDLTRRLNFDTAVGALTTDGKNEARYSMGMGLSYTVNRNLSFSIGYNLLGFKDDVLDTEKYNAKGGHIDLRYKFDEELLQWLD